MASETYESILARVLGSTDWSASAKDAVSRWQFSQSDLDRINWLAEQNGLRDLTPKERRALDSYRRVGNLLTVLQANARQATRVGA